MEEDDDFSDFGGFEAAEPVVPNVAQVGQALPGVEASPSPWAVIPPGNTVGAKPDLLCGQNKFPPLLDPSVPPVPNEDQNQQQGDGNQSASEPAADFEANFDLEFGNNSSLQQASGIDEASLANDILDGSFRSTSSTQSGASSGAVKSDQSNVNLQNNIPDVQDIASSHVNNNANSVRGPSIDLSRLPVTSGHENLHSSEGTSSCSDILQDTKVTNIEEIRTHSSSVEQGARSKVLSGKEQALKTASVKVSADTTNSAIQNSDRVTTTSHDSSITNKGGTISEMSKSAAATDGLFEDLAYIDSAAKVMREIQRETDEQIYTQHSEMLTEELKSMRKESHLAVMAVVEEYQELMKTNLEQQQETFEKQLTRSLQEQQLKFQEKLDEQQKQHEAALKEERNKIEEEMKTAIQSQVEKQKEQFETYLQEEREKSKEALENALKEERETSLKLIQQTVEEEKTKTEQYIEEERKKLEEILKDDRQKNEELTRKALEEEQHKSKEAIEKAVKDERSISEEMIKSVLQSGKEETAAHLEQQKQLDRVVRQRQLASLDVFLESARRQLTLLMEGNSHSEKDKESSES